MAKRLNKDKSFTNQTKTYKEVAEIVLEGKIRRSNWIQRLILKRLSKK